MKKHKKGLWSPDEDQRLTYYVMKHGHGCWTSVPINAGLQRNGKSCRLRWVNYLRPGLKQGAFSSQEEETILTLHGLLGNKWSPISKQLPGRTDNEIKNHWHLKLKKKVAQSKHTKVGPKRDYTDSFIAKRESSSSPHTHEDMDQSVVPVSQVSHLPKVLFADWISLDEFQQDFYKSSDQPYNHGSIHEPSTSESHGSNHELNTTEHELQHTEGITAVDQKRNCVPGFSNEAMFNTEMTMDQIFNFDSGDFYIDDLMYMEEAVS